MKTIPEIKINLFQPVQQIIDQIGAAYGDNNNVLQVKGLPLNVFAFRHPDHVADILRHQPTGMTKYPKIMPRVKHVMGNGGYILAGGSDWKKRRSLVQSAFKNQCLGHYAEQLPAITQHLLNCWDQRIAGSDSFDICRDLHALITQISFSIFLSEDLADGQHDLSSPRLETIRQQTHTIEMDFVRPLPLSLPFPSNFKFRDCHKQLRSTMETIVQQRRNNPTTDQDLLSVLLTATDADSGEAWSDTDIIDEIFSVYFGASVMGTTLSWTLYLIATHPDIQQRLIDEVQHVLGDRPFTIADLKSLPYTNQVMQEGLRLFPPSWGYPRYCSEGIQLDGYDIPG